MCHRPDEVPLVVLGDVLHQRLKSFAHIICLQTEIGLEERYNVMGWRRTV
jgi:hypothetical protein